MNDRIDKELTEILAIMTTPKFLATVGADGRPNIVPVISIEAWDERALAFGELMIRKTKSNLKPGAPVCAGVMTPDGASWRILGRFREFKRSGEVFDAISNREMFRYNAYSGIRSVGIIDVEQVSSKRKLDIPATAIGAIIGAIKKRAAAASKTEGTMPPTVAEKFSRLKAAKFISWISPDGYPTARASVALFADGLAHIALPASDMKPDLPPVGTAVAASVITFDPIAYQVKGTISSYRNYPGAKIARVAVDEVYSASPPLPGHRIY